MTTLDLPLPARPVNRNAIIAASVVLFHVAALWALQTGLLRRAVEIIVPAQVIAEFIEPPQPKVEPPPPVPKPPVLAVRIQEMFGVAATPRIAAGRVPLLLHLLGPNHRPQQVTADLASFWQNGYPEVKKELRRRYPKHSWPDDPLTTPATRSGLKRDAK